MLNFYIELDIYFYMIRGCFKYQFIGKYIVNLGKWDIYFSFIIIK